MLISNYFYFDRLSFIIIGLVIFLASCIIAFSVRYLKGDSKQNAFYYNTLALVIAIFMVASTDNILILLAFWAAGNFFLTRLMLHKSVWEAARQSALLASKNFALGFVFLSIALLILYKATNHQSIQAILNTKITAPWSIASCLFILLAAMTQSSLWPLHQWLISSLNSPTPVSAIMHAGLVNGGGFLLARFAPIFLEQPVMLNLVFVIGIITAFLGTLWKLLQNDIKRMLACSTVAQMGFMVAQCGLGLFPAAVTHLFLHGLFKAYLFLAAGSAAQQKRIVLDSYLSLKHFFLAIGCGLLGAYIFAWVSNQDFFSGETTLFLLVLIGISATQFAIPILQSQIKAKLLLAIALTMIMGWLYGFTVHLIADLLAPLQIAAPQRLNFLHIICLFILTIAWLTILFANSLKPNKWPKWILKIYVYMLNASQPHPKTVTAHRNHYQF